MTREPNEISASAADAADRGRTVLRERAVERIARAAVLEASRAGGAGRRLAGGRGSLSALPAGSDVTVQLDGHLATVRMRVSVEYPAPLRAVTRQLRDHVTETIGRLAGVEVRQVDIQVVRLIVREEARP